MDHEFSERGPSQGSGNFDTQKLKQIVKLIMYNCKRFTIQNVGFNDHRSSLDTQFKNQWENVEPL